MTPPHNSSIPLFFFIILVPSCFLQLLNIASQFYLSQVDITYQCQITFGFPCYFFISFGLHQIHVLGHKQETEVYSQSGLSAPCVHIINRLTARSVSEAVATCSHTENKVTFAVCRKVLSPSLSLSVGRSLSSETWNETFQA